MVCALDPQCSTPFGDRKMRGISATGPAAGPASAAVRPPGSFDITLNFPLNSAELTTESRSRLDRVAKALTEPSTSKMDIIISGHTDARGSADYNLLLSDRRAQAVRQFLITERGIDPKRVIAKGYGKTRPLFPSDPYNDLNRRVQFQNANYATASAPVAPAPTVTESPSAPQTNKPAAQKARPGTPAARPASSGEGHDGL
jgi:hypothetical protein